MLTRLTAPDVILVNARIETMDAHDRTAEALAIKDGRVVALGTTDEVRELAGMGTTVEDLGGRTIIPGLIDAHNHLLMTGQILGQIQLYDCRSIPEILDRVAARARALPPGSWILGRGWDESLLAERRYPSRHDLDRVAPNHPVVLHRVWNKLVCNSLALAAAGVDRATPDPPASERYGGSFDRDEHGEPTGLFRDRAKDLITAAVPTPTMSDRVASIGRACAAYNAVGLTAVAEPGLSPEELRAFHEAALRGGLSVRTDMLMAGRGFGSASDEDALQERFRSVGVQGGFGNELLRLEGIKFMPDGGIGDRTARVSEPYLGEPDNHGSWVVDPDELIQLIRWVHDLGWSIDTHTCGDEAQDVTVRAYAAAQTANPNPQAPASRAPRLPAVAGGTEPNGQARDSGGSLQPLHRQPRRELCRFTGRGAGGADDADADVSRSRRAARRLVRLGGLGLQPMGRHRGGGDEDDGRRPRPRPGRADLDAGGAAVLHHRRRLRDRPRAADRLDRAGQARGPGGPRSRPADDAGRRAGIRSPGRDDARRRLGARQPGVG